MTVDSNQSKKTSKKELKEELWKKTGFQRVLGGYWHNYIYMLLLMVFALLFMGIIFPNYILPFPEALGYRSIVTSLFALLFTVFDVGVGSAVTRFVAEYVGIGKINKALEYLRFFIWFQMITGLIQITLISYWCLHFAPKIDTFASLIWMFLLYSTIQFPGMLGIFNSGLAAFQRYDKKNIVQFVQFVFLESTTSIGFVFIGRAWGINNPEYGELMGATLGYIIGLYIDDFLAMALSAKFFHNVIKEYGFSITDTILPHFSKHTMKTAFSFGMKNMAQGIAYQSASLLVTGMTIVWMPNYSTIIGLFAIADAITRIVIQDLPVTAAVSEAFNNGKKELTKYYTTQCFKWWGTLSFFLAIEVLMLIPPIISAVAGNYAGAAWMIAPLMVGRFFITPIHFSDGVHQGCNKPEYAAYSLGVALIFKVIAAYILLAPNMLPSRFDNYNLALAYILLDVPSIYAKNVFAWWIVNKNLFKVRINLWQTIITPALSTIPLFFLNLFLLNIYNTRIIGDPTLTIVFALVGLLIILFGIPVLIYFPLLGFLGGWDDRSLQHFKEAAELAGLSKPFVRLLYKNTKFGADHCPYKDFIKKHAIPHELADKEAQELVDLRLIEELKVKS